MQQFIDQVTGELGIGASESKSATSGIMDIVRNQLGDGSFQELVDRIPGASEFLQENPAGTGSDTGGGLMGSLTSMAGGLLGGKESGIAGVAAAIAASGISVDKVGSFLTMLIGFIKEQIGAEAFDDLASKVPDLFGGGQQS